jgi:hypothetical protein
MAESFHAQGYSTRYDRTAESRTAIPGERVTLANGLTIWAATGVSVLLCIAK